MATQRQESKSPILDGCTTPETDETGRVPSLPTPRVGGTLERITPHACLREARQGRFSEAKIGSEIDAVTWQVLRRLQLATNYHRHTQTHRAMPIGKQAELVLVRVDELYAAKARVWVVARVQAHIEYAVSSAPEKADRVWKYDNRGRRAFRPELSHLAPLRRTAEVVQNVQGAIDADRRVLCEQRRQLNNSELMALSDRYEVITAELVELDHEFYADLIQKCNALQARLNDLGKQKREVAQEFRDASDRYWAQVRDGRLLQV
ncbi:hypothetical protein EDD15DRAFT_2197110 [Pisolithus albus]|nr:hypothetical protein EDD15DRAFT_2197110 [Pisolithus albus]